MPRIGQIDKSGNPVVRYISTHAYNLRLQLAATEDSRDAETGQKRPGKNELAVFKNGVFETNKPEIINMLEKSLAFESGEIMRESDLQKEAMEARYQEARNLLENDKELIERLKRDLSQRQSRLNDAVEE